MEIKDLHGIAVVSIADGAKLGTVEDVLMDGAQRRVDALRVESGGLLRRQHMVVPFTALRSIGVDAVMVADAAALSPAPDHTADGRHSAGDLDKMRVVTENGAYLGNLSNARFDPATGVVSEFEIGAGGIGGILGHKKMIDAASVTSIGPDIMVVPDALAGDAAAS